MNIFRKQFVKHQHKQNIKYHQAQYFFYEIFMDLLQVASRDWNTYRLLSYSSRYELA